MVIQNITPNQGMQMVKKIKYVYCITSIINPTVIILLV